MKIERTKNAERNILFGMILKVVSLITPFIIRTVMIYVMGAQYLGLNSMFSSVIGMLNLAELGVCEAMVYSMYKPIIEDDKETIRALMNLYRRYYRIIGMVIGCAGLICLPFIRYLVKDDIPEELNIYLLYLLYLGETVVSYWLFAYKAALFQAHQRVDVISRIRLFVTLFKFAFQLIAIVVIRDYYSVVMVILLSEIINNIATGIAADKMYPEYRASGRLSKEKTSDVNRRIRDLFTAKISARVVHSSDSIVISAFLGLSILAVYQNYFYIVTALMAVIEIFFTACMAGIGNSIILETKEKNYADLKKITFLIAWISGVCASCLLCMYQPFMRVWMNHDENLMLGMGEVICICVYFFIYELNRVVNIYKESAGLWRETRFVPLANAVVNLTLNLITVRFWGLYGVLLSTVIAFVCVEMPLLIHHLFRTIFERKLEREYVINLMLYTGVCILACVLSFLICGMIRVNDVARLFINAAVCLTVSNLCFFAAFSRKPEFAQCRAMAVRMAKEKLDKIRGKKKS
jgi:Membrane protein involved in the export of O-antigen and teichoic acid